MWFFFKLKIGSIVIEYGISFSYNNTVHKAVVLMCDTEGCVTYHIRPVDPLIVRKYGRQISIYQEQEVFNTQNQLATEHREFFNCLVVAIQQSYVTDTGLKN